MSERVLCRVGYVGFWIAVVFMLSAALWNLVCAVSDRYPGALSSSDEAAGAVIPAKTAYDAGEQASDFAIATGTTADNALPGDAGAALSESAVVPGDETGKDAAMTQALAGDRAGGREVELFVYGYCPCQYCCGKSDGITASGTVATPGRTLAAGIEYPLGTEIIIDGIAYVVEDRGGAGICGANVDMFFASHDEALRHGVRQVIAIVIEK